jgi:hypothetical protein
MAKRKTAGGSRRTSASGRAGRSKTARAGAGRAAAGRSRKKTTRTRAARAVKKSSARKAAPKRGSRVRASGSKKSAASAARKSAQKSAQKSAIRTAAARKAKAKSAGARRTGSKSRTAPSARKRTPATARTPPVTRTLTARRTTTRPPAAAVTRPRRVAPDDDLLPSPPSSLDLDRSASAARSGRRELREKFDEHTETGPAITGGDIDADWESAYSVGDEAPGGDSPTPDQDIVDDIGRAVGVEYQDSEELKGEEKIAERDRHRWELDPASSEDYDDR